VSWVLLVNCTFRKREVEIELSLPLDSSRRENCFWKGKRREEEERSFMVMVLGE